MTIYSKDLLTQPGRDYLKLDDCGIERMGRTYRDGSWMLDGITYSSERFLTEGWLVGPRIPSAEELYNYWGLRECGVDVGRLADAHEKAKRKTGHTLEQIRANVLGDRLTPEERDCVETWRRELDQVHTERDADLEHFVASIIDRLAPKPEDVTS